MKGRGILVTVLAAVLAATLVTGDAQADLCTGKRMVTANIVAIDQPVMFNRLGASNVNGMIFALERDVINMTSLLTLNNGGEMVPGDVALRPDKRPRPLVLRVRQGDCLTIQLTNLLAPGANPFIAPINIPPLFTTTINNQVLDRHVSLHVNGMQYVTASTAGNKLPDDGAFVGTNADSTVAQGASRTYVLFAEHEGAFAARGMATTVGSDANQGNASNLLFGEVIVEPVGAAIYRGQVAEEEMRLAADKNDDGMLTLATEKTTDGHPIIDYEAVYPNSPPWSLEGKGNLPVLNMMKCGDAANCEIVHSEINALVAYGGADEKVDADPKFPPSTYPLENVGKRNPTVPNRLEPFRDFASIFHDEPATKQAFPGFYESAANGGSDVFNYVLAGVKDGFMINYGSGGIGSEIIANRLGVGPMHDCLTCAYEEFFLTSFTVSDPGTLVDIPANVGLETMRPGDPIPAGAAGPKATRILYTEDPANIHHSYTGDFAKIRNVHIGKEQHVFHLHNHQWLYNPNDDNSNYLDAQGIGPGVGYTYEINFGGSGNRNKSAGDSIFHCHFYPHFAQGMWYHWRHHDVFEAGTFLQTTVDGGGWHVPFTTDGLGLGDGTPAAGARALPDAEVVAGYPIPAVVPLPGKPMAPMPGPATVKPNPLITTASAFNPTPATADLDPVAPGTQVPVGSLASIPRNEDGSLESNVNPGYPFWVAGIEDVVGQRPPTPPLDMLSPTQATALQSSGNPLWADIDPAQADGWDGGLPRAALQGVAAGGHAVVPPGGATRLDFSKVVEEAQAVFYPEEGTDLEQLAMDFHAQLHHDTFLPNGNPATGFAGFRTNGSKPVVGAPFHEPCIDDEGTRMTSANGGSYKFFSGDLTDENGLATHGSSVFHATTPRIYKGTNIQYDAVINKAGYHYPQQRIITLWQDAVPVITKEKAGQPLVIRLNTFDCAIYHHSNLVPEAYEVDDYQVRTPTDIIGQHIHLPKWDLTTADGAANGWNYEDGTLSPGAVQERILALNAFKVHGGSHLPGSGSPASVVPAGNLTALPHPYFSTVAPLALASHWLGARTTTQRWFADPVVNTEGVDRGLGIIFTHDHYGPSTHQQIGLYATVLAEPAGSRWLQNETGIRTGYDPVTGVPARTFTTDDGRVLSDGGPTAWQAAIIPPSANPVSPDQPPVPQGSNVKSENLEPFREFYFEYSDFQHAYEAGVYVGAGHLGEPLGEPTAGVETPVFVMDAGNPEWDGTAANAFRFAINPPARDQKNDAFGNPDFANLVREVAGGVLAKCPERPCPQAIDVEDPGVHVVNYRNEPVGLRIYDPLKIGPDGKPGMQADALAGDLAFALQSRTDRAYIVPGTASFAPDGKVLNYQPPGGSNINGTIFPPLVNTPTALGPGDPFTPMPRTYAGDMIRMKMQAGGHEEEHNATVHGLKWLQAGSGHGKAGNSGWRNAQAGGISEQFTLSVPVVANQGAKKVVMPGGKVTGSDYAYSMDASNDGWFSGMWGILRAYDAYRADLFDLPSNPKPKTPKINNKASFAGVCPANLDGTPANLRPYQVVAMMANELLDMPAGVTFPTAGSPVATQHVGGPLNALGGTLVYNPRTDPVAGIDAFGNALNHFGPIHDPTALLYVRLDDLEAVTPNARACADSINKKTGALNFPGLAKPDCPVTLKAGVRVEPLVLRAAAGDCIEVTLYNRVPQLPPDLATYSTTQGVVKRDRIIDPLGATTFQTNLFRPSGYVGLHPQLVEYDVTLHDGMNVGYNPVQTVDPTVAGKSGATSKQTYRWYAGDLRNIPRFDLGPSTWDIQATPVEYGGSNLQPADVVKQGAKSLVGTLVIEPANATWDDTTDDLTGRQTATVAANGTMFRDFSAVFTKGLTQYYADSSPVEHINGEGVGIPEDSQEASGMAINYRVEPLWFRAGILPEADFGNGIGGFGGVPQFDLFSNTRVSVACTAAPTDPACDPATPVFTVDAGTPFRMRVTNPYGTSRGTTFQLHGHVWQRDPYICPGTKDGILGRCATDVVGSQMIGDNKQAFFQGGQESITPATHFDIVVPFAGGKGNDATTKNVKGDFLFRDGASFGNASGLWGIVRVE